MSEDTKEAVELLEKWRVKGQSVVYVSSSEIYGLEVHFGKIEHVSVSGPSVSISVAGYSMAVKHVREIERVHVDGDAVKWMTTTGSGNVFSRGVFPVPGVKEG